MPPRGNGAVRRTESGHAPTAVAEATAAVYRHCQRAPPRVTIAAQDAVEFVHLLQAAGRVYRFGDATVLVSCALACAALVTGAAFAASGDGLLVLATLGSLVVLITAFGSEFSAEPSPRRVQMDLAGVLLVIVPIALATWWITGSGRGAWAGFSLMAVGASLVRTVVMVNGGLPGRLGLALWYDQSPSTFASRPLHEDIRRMLPRPGLGHTDLGHSESRPGDPVRAETWHRMDELAQRRTGQAWRLAAPVLGRSVPLAGDRPREPGEWGRAEPLATLEHQCEAAALFDRAAVLLLSGSPPGTLRSDTSALLRCGREPYRRVLDLLDAGPFAAAAIALAPSASMADWLLARTIAADPDATLRLDAMGHMGFGRFFAALAVSAVDRGAAGDLYLLSGFGSGTAALVRVEDRVRGVDGMPHVHWLPVPPDVSSAREAVAWTFGKSAREWEPLVET